MNFDDIYEIASAAEKSFNLIISCLDESGNEISGYPDPWCVRLLAFEKADKQLVDAVKKNHSVAIFSNSLQFVFAAVPILEDEEVKRVVVLGPVTYSVYPEKRLEELVDKSTVGDGEKKVLHRKLKEVPVIPYQELERYVKLIYYLFNKERVSEGSIRFLPEKEVAVPGNKYGKFEYWMTGEYSTSYADEQAYLEAFLNGDERVLKSVTFPGRGNVISPDDPLRQKKDEGIIAVAILARTAIKGAVNSDIALSLSEYYVRAVESAQTVAEVEKLLYNARMELWKHIRRSRVTLQYSKPVNECCRYVRDHIRDKLKAEEIAESLGYNKYYLTSIFKKETGTTLNQFVNSEKVEMAKKMLQYSNYSLSDISDSLNFGTKSYFIQIFKKITGETPKKFRLNYANTKTE